MPKSESALNLAEAAPIINDLGPAALPQSPDEGSIIRRFGRRAK